MNFAIQSTTLMMMLITNNIEYKSSPQKEILSNSVISKETEEFKLPQDGHPFKGLSFLTE